MIPKDFILILEINTNLTIFRKTIKTWKTNKIDNMLFFKILLKS